MASNMDMFPTGFSPDAFMAGIRRACEERGAGDLSGFVEKLAEFGAAGDGLGEGFMGGARSFLSRFSGGSDEYETVRKKSLLRKMLPWALALGGGALALQYGNAWGRHAALTGNDNGPVGGTIKAILEGITGKKFKYVGKGAIAPNDAYHRPLTNDEYRNIVTYATPSDPKFFDDFGDLAKTRTGG